PERAGLGKAVDGCTMLLGFLWWRWSGPAPTDDEGGDDAGGGHEHGAGDRQDGRVAAAAALGAPGGRGRAHPGLLAHGAVALARRRVGAGLGGGGGGRGGGRGA